MKSDPTKEEIFLFLLRAALAFPFLYAAITGWITPSVFIQYLPSSVQKIIPDQILLEWGIFEVIIAVWILIGKRIIIPCLLAAIALLVIILTNISNIQILFRDVSILLLALALIVKSSSFPLDNILE